LFGHFNRNNIRVFRLYQNKEFIVFVTEIITISIFVIYLLVDAVEQRRGNCIYVVAYFYGVQGRTITKNIRTGTIFRIKYYALKVFAGERIITDTFNAVGDCHARKACALIERILTYARNAVGDSYARKALAIIERVITYTRNAC